MLRLLSFLLSVLFLFLPLCHSQDTTVTASVNKTTVQTGEIFTYKVKIDGVFLSPKVILPEFKDLNLVSQSQSKNYSFKGGNTHLTLRLILKIFAANPGTFTIEKVIVEDNGKRFESNPITIKAIGEPLPKKKISPQGIGRGVEI